MLWFWNSYLKYNNMVQEMQTAWSNSATNVSRFNRDTLTQCVGEIYFFVSYYRDCVLLNDNYFDLLRHQMIVALVFESKNCATLSFRPHRNHNIDCKTAKECLHQKNNCFFKTCSFTIPDTMVHLNGETDLRALHFKAVSPT